MARICVASSARSPVRTTVPDGHGGAVSRSRLVEGGDRDVERGRRVVDAPPISACIATLPPRV